MRIRDNSAAFMQDARKRTEAKLEAAAQIVEGQAILLAPVLTGNLKNSITHRVTGLTAFVGATADYAAHVEFGTSKQSAQPFLVPALEMSKAKIRRLFSS